MFLVAKRLPVSYSQSPTNHPTTKQPSAPFLSDRNICSGSTLAVQGTKIVLNDAGYCLRIVPAISHAPYPHFQQRKAAIFGRNSPFDIFSPLLYDLKNSINHAFKRFISEISKGHCIISTNGRTCTTTST